MLPNVWKRFCRDGILIASATLGSASSISYGAGNDERTVVKAVDTVREAVEAFLGSMPGDQQSFTAVASAVQSAKSTLETIGAPRDASKASKSVAFLMQVLQGMDGKCAHGIIAVALLEDAGSAAFIDRSMARLVKEWSAAKGNKLNAGALSELATQIVNTGLYADKLGMASGDTLAQTAIFLAIGGQHNLAADIGGKAGKAGIQDAELRETLADALAKSRSPEPDRAVNVNGPAPNNNRLLASGKPCLPVEGKYSWTGSDRAWQQAFRELGLPPYVSDNHGILVTLLAEVPGGAQPQSGIQVNDVIFRIAGKTFRNKEMLDGILDSLKPGQVVEVAVKRAEVGGQSRWHTHRLSITLGDSRRYFVFRGLQRLQNRVEPAMLHSARERDKSWGSAMDYCLTEIKDESRVRVATGCLDDNDGKLNRLKLVLDAGGGAQQVLDALAEFSDLQLSVMVELAEKTDWGRWLNDERGDRLTNGQAIEAAYQAWFSELTPSGDSHVTSVRLPDSKRDVSPDFSGDPGRPPKVGKAFRDLSWGDPVTNEFERIADPGDGAILYKRQTDKLSIGEAALNGIMYAFRGGRLERVIVTCEPTNVQTIDRALRAKYGEPASAAGLVNWLTEETMISLAPKGVCIFSQKKAVDRTMQEQAEADSRGAADL